MVARPPLTHDQATRLLMVLEGLKMLIQSDDPGRLARALNARAIAPIYGKTWTRDAVTHYAGEAVHVCDAHRRPGPVRLVVHQLMRDDRAAWAAAIAKAVTTVAKANISVGQIAVALDSKRMFRLNGERWSGHYVRMFLKSWRRGEMALAPSIFDEAIGKYLRPADRAAFSPDVVRQRNRASD